MVATGRFSIAIEPLSHSDVAGLSDSDPGMTEL
jgi:hypothetical protein